MANGGIIGPVNTVNAAVCQSEVNHGTKTSNYTFTTQPATTPHRHQHLSDENYKSTTTRPSNIN